ncbi:MAG: N-acetyl-gamma-glutamyl-phosphate reductase [Eubacteriales bacterium]
MKKIFIDGAAGTTGLRIYERIGERGDLALLTLPEDLRKDPGARRRALNECDIAFLCLPDQAAVEAVAMVENPHVTVIDASTAHRTHPGFAYGFPELSAGQRERIQQSNRISVPGCHAAGFIALVAPLVQKGVLSPDAGLFCHSLTGYSGGGKSMIAQYEAGREDPLLQAPRQYGLTQQHKHLKEMRYMTGLSHEPIFCPIVSDFYSGMEVTVPLFARDIRGTIEDIRAIYRDLYHTPVVHYTEAADEQGFLSAAGYSGKDSMQITVAGNAERILLIARYDNLGKGASGAALQCMNLKLNMDETKGLQL